MNVIAYGQLAPFDLRRGSISVCYGLIDFTLGGVGTDPQGTETTSRYLTTCP